WQHGDHALREDGTCFNHEGRAMARTEDARAGWDIFKSGVNESLDDINQQLMALGRAPVSNRMFKHYKRLANAGFDRYVTINRFDTMNLPDPFTDRSVLGRYVFTDSNVQTELILHQRRGDVVVVGITD